jgi:ubiquinone/menaquinone biosynthesis C-methylase UbiE
VEFSQFHDGYGLNIFHLIIIFQAFLSSIGSISNEYVLKTQKDVPLNIQNFWMYFYGIILNSLFLFTSVYIFRTSESTGILQSFAMILSNPLSMIIVLNWCLAGVLTSYILKYLSSITKSYATAFEMIVVSASSAILFGKEVSIFFLIGSMIVIVSIFMYNSNYEIPQLQLNILISFLILIVVGLSIFAIRTKKSGDSIDQSNQWKQIWEKKGNSQQSDSLHNSGGFDIITKEQYDLMIKTLVAPIEVKKNAKIIEFGVGSGAFLSSLLKVFPHIRSPSGLDYSKPLTIIAKKNFPQGSFFVSDIRKVDFLLDETYDNVFTFSVSHYLNSEQDVKLFFSEMFRVCKKGGSIFIGDVNDFDKKELAQKVRGSSHKEQKKVSKFNPTQMYVKKSMVKEFFKSLGVKSVKIIDESNIGIDFYSNSKYRYSVYVEK